MVQQNGRESARQGAGLGRAVLALAMAATMACGAHHSMLRVGRFEVHTFERESANVHVLARDGTLVMVDSGYERNASLLDQDMRRQGLDPSHVRAVVLTHGHADHAGGAPFFRQRYGARVIAGNGDVAMLASGHNERLCPTGFLGNQRLRTDQAGTFTAFRPDVVVNEDDVFQLETLVPGWEVRVQPMPAHTAGSLVVLFDGGVLVGDLFRGGLTGASAEEHLYQCDLELTHNSIRRLLRDVAPGAGWFFTGHFGPVERGAVIERFAPPS